MFFFKTVNVYRAFEQESAALGKLSHALTWLLSVIHQRKALMKRAAGAWLKTFGGVRTSPFTAVHDVEPR